MTKLDIQETPVTIVSKTYTITFTEEEFELFYKGIGGTSQYSLESAGMTKEQSEFFTKMYSDLYKKLYKKDAA